MKDCTDEKKLIKSTKRQILCKGYRHLRQAYYLHSVYQLPALQIISLLQPSSLACISPAENRHFRLVHRQSKSSIIVPNLFPKPKHCLSTSTGEALYLDITGAVAVFSANKHFTVLHRVFRCLKIRV